MAHLNKAPTLVICISVSSLISCRSTSTEETVLTREIAPSRHTYKGNATKGPIAQAIVEAYALDSNGNKTGAAIAQTTSGTDGSWSISIPSTITDLVLVESSGGAFIDESDPATDLTKKRKITLKTGEVLQGLLIPGQTTAAINILTHGLIENIRAEISSTSDLIQSFNRIRSRAFNALGFDPFVELPTNPIAVSTGATANQKSYALLVGGLAYAANNAALKLGASQMNYEVIKAFTEDLSDCTFDGTKKSAAINVTLTTTQALPTTIKLDDEIYRFRNNHDSQYTEYRTTTPLPSLNKTEYCNPTPSISRVLPARLTGITLSSGTLSPVFSNTASNFTASVDGSVSDITVTPTLNTLGASVTVNGNNASTPVSLNVGNNTITIIVTSEDGTTQTSYTLVVNRPPKLLGLTLSTGSLTSAFNPAATSFNANLANNVTSLTITPQIGAAGATVTVNGNPATTPVSLAVGDNIFTLVVTATDTNTQASYTLTINRADLLVLSATESGIKNINFSWQTIPTASYYKLLASKDGVAAYTQVGATISGTSVSTSIAAHLTDWPNVRYVVEAYDANGTLSTSTPVSIASSMLASIGYIKPATPEALGSFAGPGAVAISGDGNTMVVGMMNEGIGDAGAAYVFARSGNTWVQEAKLTASNITNNYSFGNSVAISQDGNTVAVGSALEKSSVPGINQTPDATLFGAGAAYVFTRSGSTWTQQAYIKPSVVDAYDYFGTSVSLAADGNTLAIGVPNDDSNADTPSVTAATDNTATDAGAVYIFSRSGISWSEQSYIKASNSDFGDDFGRAVSLSATGDVLAVGAPNEASNSTTINTGQADNTVVGTGAVYIFQRSAGNWAQQSYVKQSVTGNDRFGSSVALCGNGTVLAAGAPYEDSSTTGVGSTPNESATDSGSVRVFSFNGSAWSEGFYIKPSNPDAFDLFGADLSLSGDCATLAVGARNEAGAATGINGTADNLLGSAGAVYVLKNNGVTWDQVAYVKATNPDTGDTFGSSVSLNNDGTALAVGAPNEDSSTSGVDSNPDNSATSAGAAYIY